MLALSGAAHLAPGDRGAGRLPPVRDPSAPRAGGRGGPDRRRRVPPGSGEAPGADAGRQGEREAGAQGADGVHASPGEAERGRRPLPTISPRRSGEAADAASLTERLRKMREARTGSEAVRGAVEERRSEAAARAAVRSVGERVAHRIEAPPSARSGARGAAGGGGGRREPFGFPRSCATISAGSRRASGAAGSSPGRWCATRRNSWWNCGS